MSYPPKCHVRLLKIVSSCEPIAVRCIKCAGWTRRLTRPCHWLKAIVGPRLPGIACFLATIHRVFFTPNGHLDLEGSHPRLVASRCVAHGGVQAGRGRRLRAVQVREKRQLLARNTAMFNRRIGPSSTCQGEMPEAKASSGTSERPSESRRPQAAQATQATQATQTPLTRLTPFEAD